MKQRSVPAPIGASHLIEPHSTAVGANHHICFGRYEVIPSSRAVLRNGTPVDIGGRAFDLLMALLQSRGEVISKTAIVERVWPRAIVEDNNIRVQMALLRKSLGTAGSLIKTVSGKGYVFVCEPDNEAV